MRKPVPPISESAADLKQRFKQERHAARQQRLHALYVLASGQARSRQAVAGLLGVDRNTVGRWLAQYERGGLDALLAVYIPAGKRTPLTRPQLAELHRALEQPQGFAS
jgi:transposase